MPLDDILDLIRRSESIALVAHIMPDGDTLGSCLALGLTLQSIGKVVDMYCHDECPSSYSFLKGIDAFQRPKEESNVYDLAVAIDCSDLDRLGNSKDVFTLSLHTANIDHHISNTKFAETNYIDCKAAATGEIIYDLIKKIVEKPGKYEAEALYTAISTDTGGFSFSSTTPKTYRIAADLMESNIDIDMINTRLYRSYSLQKYLLLSSSLNTLELYENNRVAILTITNDILSKTGAKDSDSESIINYAKNIQGVEIAILLKESDKNTTKVSFRSNQPIDVSQLAAQFGGGGHKMASGASMNMGAVKARDTILNAIKPIYKE